MKLITDYTPKVWQYQGGGGADRVSGSRKQKCLDLLTHAICIPQLKLQDGAPAFNS